ncbi:Hypothetical predicted protein [Prunus dulcis]|uniref:Uncharacterized protein n=1 Tax=Prunus dulcis TaxID=3755 RepID=A0A5E4GBA7_PRUDU|nr:Hypothetical predicted protein [Prunus dulcis]
MYHGKNNPPRGPFTRPYAGIFIEHVIRDEQSNWGTFAPNTHARICIELMAKHLSYKCKQPRQRLYSPPRQGRPISTYMPKSRSHMWLNVHIKPGEEDIRQAVMICTQALTGAGLATKSAQDRLANP